MIVQKVAEAVRQQDWFTVLLEILIVIIGIFLGLQVDDWNEARKADIRATDYVARISSELELDLAGIDRCLKIAEARKEMGKLLIRALADDKVVRENPARFLYAIQRAGWTWLPSINDTTFEEITQNGEFSVIPEELRTAIASYYSLVKVRQQWSYLRENRQTAFGVGRIGILTAEQDYRLWDTSYESLEVSESEAIEVLERLRSQETFVLHIPRSTNQRNIIVTCSAWQQGANELLGLLTGDYVDTRLVVEPEDLSWFED